MALWDKLTSRGGMGPTIAGGLGVGGLALYLFANVLLGGEIDLGVVLN